MSNVIEASWNEDASATVYGRITARDGTGTVMAGEGKCLKQADLASITYKVFDEAGLEIAADTVTISTSIFNTLQTTLDDPAWMFTKGFNFRHDLPPTSFPTGDQTYIVEYKFTTTGGTVGFAIYKGRATSVYTS